MKDLIDKIMYIFLIVYCVALGVVLFSFGFLAKVFAVVFIGIGIMLAIFVKRVFKKKLQK